MKQRLALVLGIILILASALFSSTLMQARVQGAPLAIPTPITQPIWNAQPKEVKFFEAASLTADTRSTCYDLSGYGTLDLHYVIDQGTTNTNTITLQFSNVTNNYVNGVAVVTANASDTGDLKEYNLFGKRTCLYADVTNSNALSVTAIGLAK